MKGLKEFNALESFILDLAMKSGLQQYTNALREYADLNPDSKQEVIEALELFLTELKSNA